MMTVLEQNTQERLDLRVPSPSVPGDSEPWRAMVGTKPVSFRFSLLPETKPRKSALGISLFIQISLVALVVTLPMLFPQRMIPRAMYMVTDVSRPMIDIPEPPKPKPPAPPKMAKVRTPVQPVVPPKPDYSKLFAPRIEAPKLKPRQVEAELPKINETFQPPVLKVDTSQPVRPREAVKTGLMAGSSAVPTTNKPVPVEKVQTGGFGDTHGVAGPGNPNKHANIGQFGDPALPPGPGYGNGTGGANGKREIVASTGFGNGVAVPPAGAGKRAESVQTSGFSNTNDQVAEGPKKKAEEAPAVESVAILFKPKPVYSAEALKLGLEGEVLLDVVFLASGGDVHVNRVVKGLGHGLDEAAVKAAQQIKYKPALSNGHAVDFPAMIHIVFQVAN